MTRCSVVIGLILCLVSLACAGEEGPGVLIAASNVRVIDGDTIQCDVLLPWGVTLRAQTVRAANYDAWESTRIRRTNGQLPSDREIAAGKQAAAAFETLIKSGRGVYLTPGKGDGGFGRLSAGIWVLTSDGEWLECGRWMTDHGHVRK